MGSINILFGIVWFLGGLIWLRRAMTGEARQSTPISSPPERSPEAERSRRWGTWVNVALYVMLGVLYLLKGIVSHQH
jgi:hypothetical protein